MGHFAQAHRCSQDAALGFANFDQMTRTSQQAFANAASSCVNYIDGPTVRG